MDILKIAATIGVKNVLKTVLMILGTEQILVIP